MKTFTKTPIAELDYEWDWSDWLGTDVFVSITFVATGGLVVDSYTSDEGKVIAWISGGTVHTSGTVTCTVTTSAGRTDSRSAIFDVQPR